MKNRYKVMVSVVLLAGSGSCFAAEARRTSSAFDGETRLSLDEQMKALQKELIVVNEKIKEIERKEEAATYQVSTGQGSLSVEDIADVHSWGADVLVAQKERAKRIKMRIAVIANQIKALKEAVIPSSTVAVLPRIVSSRVVAQVAEESALVAVTAKAEKIAHLKKAAVDKMKWIQDTRMLLTAKMEELKKLQNRYDANAGVLPEEVLAVLRNLQMQQPDFVKGLRDLVDHEEGLAKFLSENGITDVLTVEAHKEPVYRAAKIEKRRSVDAAVACADEVSPSKKAHLEVKKTVNFGTNYVTGILPNYADEDSDQEEPDLAEAHKVVAAQATRTPRGRRNASLPGEMPTIEGQTMTLPLAGGLVLAQSELDSTPSASSEAIKARRGTGFFQKK